MPYPIFSSIFTEKEVLLEFGETITEMRDCLSVMNSCQEEIDNGPAYTSMGDLVKQYMCAAPDYTDGKGFKSTA